MQELIGEGERLMCSDNRSGEVFLCRVYYKAEWSLELGYN